MGFRLPAQDCSDLPEPIQRGLIAIGHSEDPGRAAAMLQNLRCLSGFLPEYQIQPRASRLLQRFYAGIHAKAGAQCHVERLGHEILNLPHIRTHPIRTGGYAHQIVDILLNVPDLGELLGQQRPNRLAAQAVVAPEAALVKAHQSGLHPLLHIIANALDVRSNHRSNGGAHHKDHLGMIGLVQLHNGVLQPGHVAHDHIVLAHVGGEQLIFLLHAQLTIKAHAEMGGSRRAVFENDALLYGQEVPKDAHAIRRRGQITGQTHACTFFPSPSAALPGWPPMPIMPPMPG